MVKGGGKKKKEYVSAYSGGVKKEGERLISKKSPPRFQEKIMYVPRMWPSIEGPVDRGNRGPAAAKHQGGLFRGGATELSIGKQNSSRQGCPAKVGNRESK